MNLKISLNRHSDTPLNRQLYAELSQLILNGILEPGSRIPATRVLAEELGVSRPTVTACLEQLLQEGYIETRPGSGSYVSSSLSKDSLERARKTKTRKANAASVADYELSDYGKFIAKMPDPMAIEEPKYSFYCWRPALDQFPLVQWARVLGRHARRSSIEMLDTEHDPQGRLELREALAKMVKRFRHVACHPDQIFPVMGLNQGLDLVARLHLDPKSTVLVEEPGFLPASFRACGAEIHPVAVDDDGLRIDRLPSRNARENFDLAYLTPAHQFPTSAVMPLARRLEFLHWAKEHGTLVLEDDYDSEYQASGQPIAALASLDKDQRVIYLGTMNQTMFPSLGLGYLIVPPRLVPVYRKGRMLASEQMSPPIQAAIAEFINEGHMERHVKKLRSIYSKRRETLVRSLEKHFGESVSIGPHLRGVFVSVGFNIGRHGGSSLTEAEIIERALGAGVGLTSTRDFYIRKAPARQFILGIGSLNEKQIEEGVRRLSKALKER
jgi:Transcriptional regulators containing a DNA-binding HTH domain and an aminotransferase domain (MocR family) and their eukaryotic orthologs